MSKTKTQTSMRLNQITLNQLRFIREATGCSMSVILEGIINDYTQDHLSRLESLNERRQLIASEQHSMQDNISEYENELEEMFNHG